MKSWEFFPLRAGTDISTIPVAPSSPNVKTQLFDIYLVINYKYPIKQYTVLLCFPLLPTWSNIQGKTRDYILWNILHVGFQCGKFASERRMIMENIRHVKIYWNRSTDCLHHVLDTHTYRYHFKTSTQLWHGHIIHISVATTQYHTNGLQFCEYYE